MTPREGEAGLAYGMTRCWRRGDAEPSLGEVERRPTTSTAESTCRSERRSRGEAPGSRASRRNATVAWMHTRIAHATRNLVVFVASFFLLVVG